MIREYVTSNNGKRFKIEASRCNLLKYTSAEFIQLSSVQIEDENDSDGTIHVTVQACVQFGNYIGVAQNVNNLYMRNTPDFPVDAIGNIEFDFYAIPADHPVTTMGATDREDNGTFVEYRNDRYGSIKLINFEKVITYGKGVNEHNTLVGSATERYARLMELSNLRSLILKSVIYESRAFFSVAEVRPSAI